ncbi:hypothetical protein A0J61_06228 [Choanephora cucurbitarum]|uniref:Uncharacterized protein n=1 Tax=Choanephora cucurbitarum TaxID=101091 RepID=A0A1C7N9B4_9FUNG|nr:hypothetical protein A0J61_06228 [Choanephora cucurbitarum]
MFIVDNAKNLVSAIGNMFRSNWFSPSTIQHAVSYVIDMQFTLAMKLPNVADSVAMFQFGQIL